MNNSSERTVPGWLSFIGLSAVAKDSAAPASSGSINALKRRNERAYRLRLTLAILFTVGLHVTLLFGFNRKPVKVVSVEKEKGYAVELFKAPVEELVIEPEEAVESTPHSDIVDMPPPSLPELLSVPIATDFVIPPLPPAPEGLGAKVPQFVIPQSYGRGAAMAREKIFTLSELDRTPELLQSMSPSYPLELLNTNLSGLVVVQFDVDSHGEVQNSKIISSPHALFSAAVKRALLKWRFRPGMKGGRAVTSVMELPVEFAPAKD